MINKIKICLCHPKYIGVYFKDNIWKPLLSVFIGFVIMFFVLGILCSNTTFFEHSDVKSITNTLYYQEECDSIYDNNTNYVFPRIINDYNKRKNVFKIEGDCTVKIKYRPIRKVVL